MTSIIIAPVELIPIAKSSADTNDTSTRADPVSDPLVIDAVSPLAIIAAAIAVETGSAGTGFALKPLSIRSDGDAPSPKPLVSSDIYVARTFDVGVVAESNVNVAADAPDNVLTVSVTSSTDLSNRPCCII